MTGIVALTIGFGDRSLEVDVTPSSVSGSYNGSSVTPENITTGNALGTVVGGRSPYTYAWTQEGYSSNTWTIGSPSAALTPFTANSIEYGSPAFAQFRLTVTDALGLTAFGLVSAAAHNRSTA